MASSQLDQRALQPNENAPSSSPANASPGGPPSASSGATADSEGNGNEMFSGGIFGGRPHGRPYNYYDTLREASGSMAEVVQVVEEGMHGSPSREVQLRHLTTLFAIGYSPFASYTVETAAAALLAVHHYNNGISTVVPHLSHLSSYCPLRFTIEVLDASTDPIGAARTLKRDILSRLSSRIHASNSGGSSEQEAGRLQGPVPTALFESLRASATLPTAILSGIYELPQLAGSGASTEFDNRDKYPSLARLMASSEEETYRSASFFQEVLQSTHAGVIYQRDTYGINYMKTFQSIVESGDADGNGRIDVVTSSVPFTIEDTPKELKSSIRILCESGYRHFLAVLMKQQIALVIEEAYNQGCAGEGYVWVFSEFPPYGIKVPPSSPIIPALRGAAAIYLAAPSPIPTSFTYSKFFESWPTAFHTEEQLEYLWNKMPASVTGPGGVLHGRTTFPINRFPFPYMTNAYDAAIALIDASCRAAQLNETFTGPQFFQALLETDFQGANGRVAFDKKTGSRKSGSLPYVVAEFVPSEVGEDGLVDFKSEVKYVYNTLNFNSLNGPSNEDTFAWFLLPGQTFNYSNGNSVPPPSLPPVQESNFHLTAVMRIFGLSLSAATLVACILFATWTIRWRNTAVVRAAQPIFLFFLCVGAFLMALSLTVNGLQQPLENDVLDVACMAIPWLFSLGFVITFSSLFAKLRRVNKIFNHSSHKRVVVKEKDVLLPAIVVLVFLLVSLTVATILNPLSYQRVSTGAVDRFDRPIAFYYTCRAQSGDSYDWTVVVTFFVIVVIATVREAYFARTLPTEFSESKYIFLSMVLISEAIAMALPVYFLGSPRMQYVTVSVIVPIICISLLVPIFLPKIVQLHRDNFRSRRSSTVHVSSGGSSYRSSASIGGGARRNSSFAAS